MNNSRKKGRDAMNAVTEKLKSRSGISLAIALVFFLLCAMVGTVVLSAASASAGNTARERQLYRQTQALISAADLLSQDISQMTYSGGYTRKEVTTTTVDLHGTRVVTSEIFEGGTPKLENTRFFGVKTNQDGSSWDNLNLTVRYYWNQGETTLLGDNASEPEAQTIVFHSVKEQNIPQVTGKLTVEQDYTLTVELQCGENTLTLSFPASADSQITTDGPVTEKLSDYSSRRISSITYSVSISWGQPLLKEGGGEHG